MTTYLWTFNDIPCSYNLTLYMYTGTCEYRLYEVTVIKPICRSC